MQPVPVPESAKAEHPRHTVVTMGRPRDVPEEECGSAQMLIGNHPAMTSFPGRDQLVYFRPTTVELARLNEGGLIEMNQIGTVVQPFALNVVPSDEP